MTQHTMSLFGYHHYTEGMSHGWNKEPAKPQASTPTNVVEPSFLSEPSYIRGWGWGGHVHGTAVSIHMTSLEFGEI